VTDLSVRILDEKLAEEARVIAGQLAGDQVASRMTAQEPTLWGPEAEHEASIRLSWTTLPETSRPLVGRIEALRAELRGEGVDRVVLAGIPGPWSGGSRHCGRNCAARVWTAWCWPGWAGRRWRPR
jgi:glucose-6-phosphate isomerase